MSQYKKVLISYAKNISFLNCRQIVWVLSKDESISGILLLKKNTFRKFILNYSNIR